MSPSGEATTSSDWADFSSVSFINNSIEQDAETSLLGNFTVCKVYRVPKGGSQPSSDDGADVDEGERDANSDAENTEYEYEAFQGYEEFGSVVSGARSSDQDSGRPAAEPVPAESCAFSHVCRGEKSGGNGGEEEQEEDKNVGSPTRGVVFKVEPMSKGTLSHLNSWISFAIAKTCKSYINSDKIEMIKKTMSNFTIKAREASGAGNVTNHKHAESLFVPSDFI